MECPNITVAMATELDLESIFRMRHEIYATELGQHAENDSGRLTDSLDAFNTYIVARVEDEVVGFISVTPPDGASYSVDKYFSRHEVPVPFDDGLYELRILTVAEPYRGGLVAPALTYAALRWVEERGGRDVIAIGRVDLLYMYVKAGLTPTGKRAQSGALTFELLTGAVSNLSGLFCKHASLMERFGQRIDWRLDTPGQERRTAYHGGAFFDAIGREFDHLERIDDIISADVLDAWFPPSPDVLRALSERLEWTVRTSPPTGCEGLITRIAAARGVAPEAVLPGGGSSSLIFLAMRQWLTRSSRTLVLDPTYGEYTHVFDNVINCATTRFRLDREDGYRVDLGGLETELEKGYDLCVIVNPNNPTGRHIPRAALEDMLKRVPAETTIWLDETYVDYVGADSSLERFAAASRNVVVCKSMSKAYALSGLRVGYLCGPPRLIEPLRMITPPWSVSLPGQLAAVMALQDPGYYRIRYAETRRLREDLAGALSDIVGMNVVPGVGNYLLCHIPHDGPSAELLLEACRKHSLYLRDAGMTAPTLGDRAVRIAVKDAATNRQIVDILQRVIKGR